MLPWNQRQWAPQKCWYLYTKASSPPPLQELMTRYFMSYSAGELKGKRATGAKHACCLADRCRPAGTAGNRKMCYGVCISLLTRSSAVLISWCGRIWMCRYCIELHPHRRKRHEFWGFDLRVYLGFRSEGSRSVRNTGTYVLNCTVA